ncbi:unnamed protein product [Trichobilharzia szidati]|nr:unnamed protein product [Trichobilharzia szidati]
MSKVKQYFKFYPKCLRLTIIMIILFSSCFHEETVKVALGSMLFEFNISHHNISKLFHMFPCEHSQVNLADHRYNSVYFVGESEEVSLSSKGCITVKVCLLPYTISWDREEIANCKYQFTNKLQMESKHLNNTITNNISFVYKDIWPESLLLVVQLKNCCTLRTETGISASDSLFFLPLGSTSASKQIHNGTMKKAPYTNFSVEASENQTDDLIAYYRILCDDYFYGENCSIFCKEQEGIHGNYKCDQTGRRICEDGWSGDTCTDAVCKLGCQHGRCIKPDYCHCDVGWYGKDCRQCRVYPGCLHGGCEVNKTDSMLVPFTCECEDGWGGMLCDKDLRYCSNNLNLCENNGICVNNEASSGLPYYCVCPPGFNGDHCEMIEYDCRIHGCNGHGECLVNNIESASCYCHPGYYGSLCQFNQTTCDESPCQATGSVCRNREITDLSLALKHQRFKCICPPGFSGFNCEININECVMKPCKNGGLCKDLINGYQCTCPFGYAGVQCDIKEHECINEQCPQGYTCLTNNTRSVCVSSSSSSPAVLDSFEDRANSVTSNAEVQLTYLKFSHFSFGLSSVIYITFGIFIVITLMIVIKCFFKLTLLGRIPRYDSEADVELSCVHNSVEKWNNILSNHSKSTWKSCYINNNLYTEHCINTPPCIRNDYL